MKKKIIYFVLGFLFLQFIVLFGSLFFYFAFWNEEEELHVISVSSWESPGLLHTTYFYKVENKSKRNALISFVVEATCEDGTVYSDNEMIEVQAGKTRRSSTFFSTDGKQVEHMEVVSISPMNMPSFAF